MEAETRFRDRAAIVTGAANGIGRAIAIGLAREGAAVTMVDRKPADATRRAIEAAGGRALTLDGDVTEAGMPARAVEETLRAFGRLDILVNNAGVGSIGSFLDLTPEEYERTMRVNVTAPLFFGQAAARAMAARGGGRIVNIASISGQRAGWRRTAYGTSKAAIIHLTRQMAVELGPLGVTCNAIGPGPIETELAQGAISAANRSAYNAMIPLGRFGEVEEVAYAALFLCSDAASYVTGHVLNVDGGYIAAGIKYGN